MRDYQIAALLDDYETEVRNSSIRKGKTEKDLAIFTLGLNGEAGEVAEKVKKFFRGDGEIDKDALIRELHDVLWYLISLCHFFDITFIGVMQIGLKKMRDRKARGTTRGNGDNR